MDERAYARYMADVAYFLAKLEKQPNSKYFMPIALAYNKMEKYDESISVCLTALSKYPSYCPIKTLLAEAYVYKGDTQHAKSLLFDVITEDPDNYKALRLLGTIYKAADETGEALKYFKAAYIRAPEDDALKNIIQEMGASVLTDDLFEENRKRTGDSSWMQGDDKSYKDIEQRIRSAEVMMSDLVSDSEIAKDLRKGSQLVGDSVTDMLTEDELNKLIAGESLRQELADSKDEPLQISKPTVYESEPVNPQDLSRLNQVLDSQATTDDVNDGSFFVLDESILDEEPVVPKMTEAKKPFATPPQSIKQPVASGSVPSFEKAKEVISSVQSKPSQQATPVTEANKPPAASFGERRQMTSTFGNDKAPVKFSLEDMIGDDVQGLSLPDEKPSESLGVSVPFTQRDILDEILAASDAADAGNDSSDDDGDDQDGSKDKTKDRLLKLQSRLGKLKKG